MAEKRKMWRVKDAAGNLEQVYPQTTADNVIVDAIDGLSATDVQGVLEEIKNIADTGGVTSVNGKTGTVTLTKSDVGLGNVDNTADSAKSVASAVTATKDASGNIITSTYATKSELTSGLAGKQAAGSYATLDSDGKVPASQLPSYVDDVLEYANKGSFPTTGEAGKIYVAKDTNITYRWSGTSYIEISASLALGETSSTAYAGSKGKANADAISALQTRAGDIEAKNTSQDTAIEKAQSTADTAVTNAATAQSAAEAAQSKADTNATAITKITDGTTKVSAASKADALSSAKTFAVSGDATGSVTSNLSGTTTIPVTLANSGVTAGSYSAVTVDAKGRVTAGGTSIEFGTSGQSTPSANLMVGGLFFELQ